MRVAPRRKSRKHLQEATRNVQEDHGQQDHTRYDQRYGTHVVEES